MTLSDVKLTLRDTDLSVVEAWQHHFSDLPNVTVDEGDIFRRSADAIVSPANSFGFMDGGIDLAYSLRFGWDVQARLQDLIHAEHDGELPVGKAVIIPTGDVDFPWLVSAPTMRVPMDVSGTANAYLAFRAVLRAVREFNFGSTAPIRSVLCPGLGTAIGLMPAEACAIQMRAAYDAVVLGQAPKFGRLRTAQAKHFELLGEIHER